MRGERGGVDCWVEGSEGGEERGVCEEGLELGGSMRLLVSFMKLVRVMGIMIYVLSFRASGNHCSDGSGGAGRLDGRPREVGPRDC